LKILSVRPKGIYVDLEFSVENLKHLLDFLDKCRVTYDSEEEPEFREAELYVKKLAKTLDQLVEDINKGFVT